jgi:hypothetical protein
MMLLLVTCEGQNDILVNLILFSFLPLILGQFSFPETLQVTILVLTSLMFAPILLFTGEINITPYPAHIPDPTLIFS